MEKDIYCEYKNKYNENKDKDFNKDKIKVFQIFSSGGKVIIGNRSYPITYGGLYFINVNENYSIFPENENDYFQNVCMMSGMLLDDLARLLNFEKVTNDIFKNNGGYYLPLQHYKIVDSRFKEIFGIYNANNHYSKGLLISKLMDIFNYVVMTSLDK